MLIAAVKAASKSAALSKYTQSFSVSAPVGSAMIANLSLVLNHFSSLISQTSNLGSGLVDHIQKMTAAAMQMADMKVRAHRS